jgi:hypothetical protein
MQDMDADAIAACGACALQSSSYYYETLYHIPSSCMVIIVHVVKGHQYNAHIHAPIMEMESEADSRPRK